LESLNIYSLELLEQLNKVEEECVKLQALVDDELEDINFMWCPDSQFVMFTSDVFLKQKRQKVEDVGGEQSQE
jgi:hypothetical protein